MANKGYWIAQVDVSDPEGYKGYLAVNGAAFARYGGRFVVRGGPRREVMEGAPRARNVVIEFPDFESAVACYRSPDYARAIACRQGCAVADVVILEGYDGPQPGEE